MYAECNNKMYRIQITEENPSWKTIEVKRVRVKNGKVEIGFLAHGAANSFCQIDDVTFVKSP